MGASKCRAASVKGATAVSCVSWRETNSWLSKRFDIFEKSEKDLTLGSGIRYVYCNRLGKVLVFSRLIDVMESQYIGT